MEPNPANQLSEISLDDILEQTAKEYIARWQEEGMNEDDLIKRLQQNIPSAYQKVIEHASSDYLNYIKGHFYEISAQYRQDDNVFLSHQDQKWGRCFAASEAMYQLVIEIAEEYTHYVAEKVSENVRVKHQNVYGALVHIHGRVCQIYLEILCLIKNGFADAATARWRTMYELCYIADFIKAAGEETAKAFLSQSNSSDQSQTWAINAPQILARYSKAIERKHSKGEEFVPNLGQIRECCDFTKRWAQQYKIGCFTNHASPQGTLGRVANATGIRNMIAVGKSDYGIVEPAVDSASVLSIVTSLFVTIYPNAEGIARSNMLTGWASVIREMYLTADREIFKELYDKEDE